MCLLGHNRARKHVQGDKEFRANQPVRHEFRLPEFIRNTYHRPPGKLYCDDVPHTPTIHVCYFHIEMSTQIIIFMSTL